MTHDELREAIVAGFKSGHFGLGYTERYAEKATKRMMALLRAYGREVRVCPECGEVDQDDMICAHYSAGGVEYYATVPALLLATEEE